MSAKSVPPLMREETSTHRSKDEWVGYELMGNSALFKGDYKALLLGICIYNIGAAALFSTFGALGELNGTLLWPAAILHELIGAAMLRVVLTSSVSPAGTPQESPTRSC